MYKKFSKLLGNLSGIVIHWPYHDIQRAQEISNGFENSGPSLEGIISIIRNKKFAIRSRQNKSDNIVIGLRDTDYAIHIDGSSVYDHKNISLHLQASDSDN